MTHSILIPTIVTRQKYLVLFQNVKKFPLILTHLNFQEESIENSLSALHHLKVQINDLQQSI